MLATAQAKECGTVPAVTNAKAQDASLWRLRLMRKKCKRKVWATNINPVAHAIAGACVADSSSLDKLRICELTAIDAMSKGLGTVEDWRWLADVVNIAETMGKNGIGPEVLPYCEAVQTALLEAAERYQKTRKMGLSGVGLSKFRELWAYHDLQRTSVSRSEYEKMIQKTANFIRSKGKDVVEIA